MLSLSQFQFPVEEVSSGYSRGDIIASRTVIMASYISRKTSKHMCLSTQRVLHSPGSLLWELSGRKYFRVNSNICCRFGLLFKNRNVSLINPIRFLGRSVFYGCKSQLFSSLFRCSPHRATEFFQHKVHSKNVRSQCHSNRKNASNTLLR